MKTDLSITHIGIYHGNRGDGVTVGGNMALGSVLKARRTAQGWTQEEIAKRATDYAQKDVDQTHVSYWERDSIKRPTGEQLRMLAHAYEMPVVDLVIAAGYLTRADLPNVQPNATRGETREPSEDPAELIHQVATLMERLDRLMQADRESRERSPRTVAQA